MYDPYVHALFGGAHLARSAAVTPIAGAGTSGASTQLAASQDSFAMAIGGGFDMHLRKHVLARLVQVEYVLTRLEAPSTTNLSGPSSNRNQNNVRYSADIVFHLGASKKAGMGLHSGKLPVTKHLYESQDVGICLCFGFSRNRLGPS